MKDDAIVIVPDAEVKYAIRVEQIPLQYALHQNYPNPFNPSTVLSFSLPVSGLVTLTVFNMLGQEVATLLHNEEKESGNYEAMFDASNRASGVYFYRITATAQSSGKVFADVKRMMLVK